MGRHHDAARDVASIPARYTFRARLAFVRLPAAATCVAVVGVETAASRSSRDKRTARCESRDSDPPRSGSRMKQRCCCAVVAGVRAADCPSEGRDPRYWRELPAHQAQIDAVLHLLQHHREQARVLEEERRALAQPLARVALRQPRELL